MDGKEEILNALHDFKSDVMKRFNDGDRRFDKQDIAIQDIQDQIKGNPEKDIIGIRPALKEVKSILIIPILIKKMPGWARWVLGAITLDAVVDINHMGIISFFQWLVHLTKP